MKLHEREMMLRKLASKLDIQLLDALKEADLTYGETVRVLTEVYGGMLASVAKYMIREERHGDPNKCGGLAYDEDNKEEKKEEKEFDVEAFCKESDPPPPKGEEP